MNTDRTMDTTIIKLREKAQHYLKKETNIYNDEQRKFTYSVQKFLKETSGEEIKIRINSPDSFRSFCNKLLILFDKIDYNLIRDGFLKTSNSELLYEFRQSLYDNENYEVSDDIATTYIDKDKVNALIQIKPDNNESDLNSIKYKVLEQLSRLSDATADIFDIMNNLWARNATNQDKSVLISSADVCASMGYLPQKTSDGTNRSAYRKKQLRMVAEQVSLLSTMKITVRTHDTEEYIHRGITNAINISSHIEQTNKKTGEVMQVKWYYAPGDIFKDTLYSNRGREFLTEKILSFDSYHFKYEKRLARYLCHKFSLHIPDNIFKVSDLLSVTKMTINHRYKVRNQEALERVLDNLQSESVISSWTYQTYTDVDHKRGWFDNWIDTNIIIIPPRSLLLQYKELDNQLSFEEIQREKLVKYTVFNKHDLMDALTRRNISIENAAVEMDINPSTLYRIIKSNAKPRIKTKEAILNWLNK
jgi:hypothetical protein